MEEEKMEDLLPPPPKRNGNVGSEGLLPPPPIKKKTSSTAGTSSVIGSANPLNPAVQRNVTPFNFAQQQDPETYNRVQAQKQQATQAQSNRLKEIQGVYDLTQGQGTSAAIQEALLQRDQPKPTTTESMGNSLSNMATRLKGVIPRLNVVAADTWENVLGKELANKWYELEGRDIDQVRDEAYTDLDELAQQVKPTMGMVESIQNNNWKGVAAATVNAVTSLGSTAIPAIATGGAGLFTEMTGDALVDFNETKAKRLGIPVDELYKQDKAEFGIPATIGALSGALELYGMKGVKNLITDKIKGQGFKKALLFFGETQKEGLTEFVQTGLEEANRALGEGYNEEEATKRAVDRMFSKQGLESYLQGVVGAGVAGGMGKLTSVLTDPKAKSQFQQKSELADELQIALTNSELNPQSRSVIEAQLNNTITEAADIIEKDIKAENELSPEQNREVETINAQLNDLNTTVNDPNVPETVRNQIEAQIKPLEDQLSEVISKPAEAKTESVSPIGKPTDVQVDDVIQLEDGKRGKVTGIEGNMISVELDNGATLTANPSFVEMSVVRPTEAPQASETIPPTGTTTKVEETITEPKTEKQQEKEERESVFNVPLSEATKAIDALIKKEKEKPDGYGAFIEMKDARESKAVVEKYNNATELSDAELAKDFREALFGNPTTWYADGLKLRESIQEQIKRGKSIEEITQSAQNVFIKDGYSQSEAKNNVAKMLEPILKNATTETSKIPNEIKQPEVTTQEVVEEDLSQKRTEEVLAKAEDDLKALKQVTDKTKKYEASMKRLTDAKNAKEITVAEFNDLKSRFDDVIGESTPKIKEETNNAISIESTKGVDVRQPSQDGGTVEQGNTEGQEVTGTQETQGARPEEVPITPKEEKVSKAGDPLRAFATKVREGKINKLGGFKAATGFDGAWDLGLEAVATTLEGGAKIADAIESGLKAIKKTDWYKNLENKEDFDDQYRSHMENEYGVEEKKATALKNKDIANKREELGMEPRESVVPVTNEETINEAQKKIKDGYDTEQLIDEVLENKKQGITAEEVVILKEYQLAKEQQLIDLNDKIVAATEDGRGYSLDKMIDERDVIINDIQRSYEAGERAGTISARALQARKIALMNDYSLANMLIQKRKANGDQRLTQEQIDKTTEDYTRIKKLNDQLAKKIEVLTKENDDLKANKAIKSLKNLVEYEERKMGRVTQRENIDRDISEALESFSKKLKAQAGKLSMNAIPVDLIPDVAKLAKLYAKKGINTIEGIVDAMYTNLKNDIDGLTKEELREVLINYDYDADAKQESRLKAFKKRTQARIDELRGRIDRKDFARRTIQPIQLDEEGLNLQDELRKAKFQWDYEIEKDRLNQRTQLERYRDAFTEIMNTPRALMASIDYSAPLRQGLVLGINNPKIAGRAFVEMFRQSWSEKRFDRWLADLKESPGYTVMDKAGLYIADPHNPKLSAKEEQFMSNLAEKIPFLGRAIKVNFAGKERQIGGLIKGSERAYIGYLNKLRADVFAKTAEQFENEGKTIENSPQLYEALASYINSATGRGNLGVLENSAQILNSTFFSPRLIASRIGLLTNWANPSVPKEIRIMHAKDMLRFIAVGTTLLSLASLAGADVEDDPRSSDFGKIRIGDKRWDIWGGFQQFVRFFSQLATGQRKSTADKAIREINGEGFRGETRADLVLNMMRSKLAPVPATIWNLAAGKNMVGEEYTWKDVPQSFLPLFAADVWKATDKDGVAGMLGTGVPGIFGVGVQDYSKTQDKPKTKAEVKEEVQKALEELRKQRNKNN